MTFSPLLRAEFRRAIIEELWGCCEYEAAETAKLAGVGLTTVGLLVDIVEAICQTCDIEMSFPQPKGIDENGNVT